MLKLKQLPDYTWKVPAPVGTWIVGPDQHNAPPGDPEGGVAPKALGCLLRGVQIVKPDGYIDLGDIGEWSSVSPWKYKRQRRPSVSEIVDRLDEDTSAVRQSMAVVNYELNSVGCTRKIQFQGNHEVWVDNMMEEWQKIMHPRFRIENILDLKEQGYAGLVPYGDYVKLGDLYLYHGGHFGGQYHAAAHLRNLSASVMYAHYHDYQVAKTGLLGKGLHAAWCIGFLGKPRKPFMKGRPTNWSHNFAIVHVEKSGHFHVEVVEIYDGVCYIQGQKVTG